MASKVFSSSQCLLLLKFPVCFGRKSWAERVSCLSNEVDHNGNRSTGVAKCRRGHDMIAHDDKC